MNSVGSWHVFLVTFPTPCSQVCLLAGHGPPAPHSSQAYPPAQPPQQVRTSSRVTGPSLLCLQIPAECGSWHRLLARTNLFTSSSTINQSQKLGLSASPSLCGMSAAASAACIPAAPAAAAGRSLWRSGIAAASNDAAGIYAAAYSHAAACTRHSCALPLSASQMLSDTA